MWYYTNRFNQVLTDAPPPVRHHTFLRWRDSPEAAGRANLSANEKRVIPEILMLRRPNMKTQRLTRPALLTWIAFVLAAGLPATAPALADTEPCQTVAAKRLESLGIAATEVKDISMIKVLNSPEFGTVREWQAWATLQSRSGNVVFKMTTGCRVKEAYTRGGCRVENVAHF